MNFNLPEIFLQRNLVRLKKDLKRAYIASLVPLVFFLILLDMRFFFALFMNSLRQKRRGSWCKRKNWLLFTETVNWKEKTGGNWNSIETGDWMQENEERLVWSNNMKEMKKGGQQEEQIFSVKKRKVSSKEKTATQVMKGKKVTEKLQMEKW